MFPTSPKGSDVDWVGHERLLQIKHFEKFEFTKIDLITQEITVLLPHSDIDQSISLNIYLSIYIYLCSPPARWGSLDFINRRCIPPPAAFCLPPPPPSQL
jgi:hypothetical protein